jgi:hypothetical protein
MADLGKMLLVLGGCLMLAGVVLMLLGRVPGVGRLPGDIVVQRGHWTFSFPLATSIAVSVLLTLLFWLFGRR